jgi:hypothetical protein
LAGKSPGWPCAVAALVGLACGSGPAKYCEQRGFSSLVVDPSGVYAYSNATGTVKRLLSSPDDSLDHAVPLILAQRTIPGNLIGDLGGSITSDEGAVYWTLDVGSTIDAPVATVQRMDKASGAVTTIARTTQGILPLVPDGGWLYGFDLVKKGCNGSACTFALAFLRMPSTGGTIETLFETAPGPQRIVGYDSTVLDADTVWFNDAKGLLARAPKDRSAGPVVVWSDRPVQDLFLDAQYVYFTGGPVTSSCGASCTLYTDPSGTFRADKKTLAVEHLALSPGSRPSTAMFLSACSAPWPVAIAITPTRTSRRSGSARASTCLRRRRTAIPASRASPGGSGSLPRIRRSIGSTTASAACSRSTAPRANADHLKPQATISIARAAGGHRPSDCFALAAEVPTTILFTCTGAVTVVFAAWIALRGAPGAECRHGRGPTRSLARAAQAPGTGRGRRRLHRRRDRERFLRGDAAVRASGDVGERNNYGGRTGVRVHRDGVLDARR